jgi:hypothetical protein
MHSVTHHPQLQAEERALERQTDKTLREKLARERLAQDQLNFSLIGNPTFRENLRNSIFGWKPPDHPLHPDNIEKREIDRKANEKALPQGKKPSPQAKKLAEAHAKKQAEVQAKKVAEATAKRQAEMEADPEAVAFYASLNAHKEEEKKEKEKEKEKKALPPQQAKKAPTQLPPPFPAPDLSCATISHLPEPFLSRILFHACASEVGAIWLCSVAATCTQWRLLTLNILTAAAMEHGAIEPEQLNIENYPLHGLFERIGSKGARNHRTLFASFASLSTWRLSSLRTTYLDSTNTSEEEDDEEEFKALGASYTPILMLAMTEEFAPHRTVSVANALQQHAGTRKPEGEVASDISQPDWSWLGGHSHVTRCGIPSGLGLELEGMPAPSASIPTAAAVGMLVAKVAGEVAEHELPALLGALTQNWDDIGSVLRFADAADRAAASINSEESQAQSPPSDRCAVLFPPSGNLLHSNGSRFRPLRKHGALPSLAAKPPPCNHRCTFLHNTVLSPLTVATMNPATPLKAAYDQPH